MPLMIQPEFNLPRGIHIEKSDDFDGDGLAIIAGNQSLGWSDENLGVYVVAPTNLDFVVPCKATYVKRHVFAPGDTVFIQETGKVDEKNNTFYYMKVGNNGMLYSLLLNGDDADGVPTVTKINVEQFKKEIKRFYKIVPIDQGSDQAIT